MLPFGSENSVFPFCLRECKVTKQLVGNKIKAVMSMACMVLMGRRERGICWYIT
jgi:hypothetical protein